MSRELWDEVSLPCPCCFWSCKPLGLRLKAAGMYAAPPLLRPPQWLLRGRFCLPWLSVSMAIRLGAPLRREHPHGFTWEEHRQQGQTWGETVLLRPTRAALAGWHSGGLLVGLPFKLWGNSADFDFIIQLPNCCFSLVLAGFTASCSPPAPTGLVSPLRVSPWHWGAVLTSGSQPKGPTAAASLRHGQISWAGA